MLDRQGGVRVGLNVIVALIIFGSSERHKKVLVQEHGIEEKPVCEEIWIYNDIDGFWENGEGC